MRRTEKPNKSIIIFLLIAGLFNLLSYALDQMVVQQEDKIRDLNRGLNAGRNQIESFTYSLNTIQDLKYNIKQSSNNFYNSIDLNTRAVQFFNPITYVEGLEKKFSKNDISDLNNYYKQKIYHFIDVFNARVDQVSEIYKNNFNSGHVYEIVKDMGQHERLIQSTEHLKIKKKLFDEFNFSEKLDAQGSDKNYSIYEQVYRIISDFRTQAEELDTLYYYINEAYLTSFTKYYDLLDNYADEKNKTNYYILISILSQILGITFFLLLFREILKGKYEK